jgi:hypothetical protein
MKYDDFLFYTKYFLIFLLIIGANIYLNKYIGNMPGTKHDDYKKSRKNALMFKYTVFTLCLAYIFYIQITKHK